MRPDGRCPNGEIKEEVIKKRILCIRRTAQFRLGYTPACKHVILKYENVVGSEGSGGDVALVGGK